ncbi:MAG: hypothetical protein PVF28_05840 [Thioalkalispiraceae bacterium]|jgi:hypothetical protein
MIAKFSLVFLIVFLSIVINLPDSMIARLGLDANYLLAALAAIAIAGLLVHRRMLLIFLVLLCTIGANLPESVIEHIGIDRDILFATLIALVIVPFIAGKIEIS